MYELIWHGDWQTTLTIWGCCGSIAGLYFYYYVWPVIDSFRHGKDYCVAYWQRVGLWIGMRLTVALIISAIIGIAQAVQSLPR